MCNYIQRKPYKVWMKPNIMYIFVTYIVSHATACSLQLVCCNCMNFNYMCHMQLIFGFITIAKCHFFTNINPFLLKKLSPFSLDKHGQGYHFVSPPKKSFSPWAFSLRKLPKSVFFHLFRSWKEKKCQKESNLESFG